MARAIALFAGCGGFSLGFKQAGFDVVGFSEVAASARKIYSDNFPQAELLGTDITQITSEEAASWRGQFGEIDVLFGGPPCQGFSLAGKRDIEDPRNVLFLHFVRIAAHLRPKAILLENVRVLTSMRAADGSLVADNIVESFRQVGYHVGYREMNAQHHGVPQFRERVFFCGLRDDLPQPPSFPAPTHALQPLGRSLFDAAEQQKTRTFRDACGDLQSLESGEASEHDEWHFAITHPPHVIAQLRDIPEGESAHNNPNPALRPNSGFNTTYKRIKWDEPCSTIGTTFAMISASRNVHPTNTRSLTIREALRAQTFPDTFRLSGTLGEIRTAIGNAVPPLFAKVWAGHLWTILGLEKLENATPETCKNTRLVG